MVWCLHSPVECSYSTKRLTGIIRVYRFHPKISFRVVKCFYQIIHRCMEDHTFERMKLKVVQTIVHSLDSMVIPQRHNCICYVFTQSDRARVVLSRPASHKLEHILRALVGLVAKSV